MTRVDSDVVETFRHPGYTALLALVAIAGCVGLAVFYFSGVMLPASPNKFHWLAIWSCGAFCAAMASYFTHLFFRTREQLTIDGRVIVIKGVFRTTAIDLAQVSAALWNWRAYGSIRLEANQRRVWIDLNIQPSNRLTLIRCLRRGIPTSVQRGWADFYYYQFTDRQDRWDRPTGPHTDQSHCDAPNGSLSGRLQTRTQFALYCALPLVFVFLLPVRHPIAVVLKWLTGAVWLGLEFQLFRLLRESHRRERRYLEEKYNSAELD